MSPSFAARLGIQVESISDAPVTLANGFEQPVSRTVQPVPLLVGADYTEDLHFTVTDLTHDVISGLPWLESGNKSVDWRRRTIAFVHEARLVTLQAGRPSTKHQWGTEHPFLNVHLNFFIQGRPSLNDTNPA
jgi:hypothetical protein